MPSSPVTSLISQIRTANGQVSNEMMTELERLLEAGRLAEQRAQHAEQAALQAATAANRAAAERAAAEETVARHLEEVQRGGRPQRNPTGEVPRFDGNAKDLRSYLTMMRCWLLTNQGALDPVGLATLATQQLSGAAKTWFLSECRRTGFSGSQASFPFQSIEDLLAALEHAFPENDQAGQARSRLDALTLRPPAKMGVAAYVQEFKTLQLDLPGVSPEEQHYAFLRGLHGVDKTTYNLLGLLDAKRLSVEEIMLRLERSAAPMGADNYSRSRGPEPMQIDALLGQPRAGSQGNGRGRGQRDRGPSGPPRGPPQNQGDRGSPTGESLPRLPSKYSREEREAMQAWRKEGKCLNCGGDHLLRECEVPGIILQAQETQEKRD
jgi:hypothetical protein